ncbi:hypothetical protein BCEP27_60147 [Burkholderia cepacia]
MPSGIAQTPQRSRASFQYAVSQATQIIVCDKLPHSAQRFGSATAATRAASARTCDKATRIVRRAELRIIATLLTPRLNEACGASEYTSGSSPVCPTCPQLRLQPAVRPMTQGACGGSSTAAPPRSTRSRSCRARSRSG